MKVTLRPTLEPQREIDITRLLVSAIAAELWRRYGGNAELNWLEAELHLQRIVGQARVVVARSAVGRAGTRRGERAARRRGMGRVRRRIGAAH